MKKLILTLPIIILLFASVAYADKGMIPVNHLPIYEPSQKAVIAWNNDTEIILLSVDLKTENGKTKVIEVLPLPSKPEIEEGSTKTFEVLMEYVKVQMLTYGEKGLRVGEGIEIVFHEKIGYHDVTVVRVEKAEDFVSWIENFVNKHGLAKPLKLEEAVRLVNDYIKKGFNYFVVDLVEVEENIKTVKPLIYKFKCDHLYFPLKISSLAKGETTITLFILTKENFPSTHWKTQEKNGFAFPILTKPIPTTIVMKADQRLIEIFKKNNIYPINIMLTVATYQGSLQNLQDFEVIPEKWIPYQPNPEQVELSMEQKNGKTLIKTTITFKNAGFKVFWGSVTRENNVFKAYSKIEGWTGPSAQVITIQTNIYDLGLLKPGKYTFEFYANDKPIKSIIFEVQPSKEQYGLLTSIWSVLAITLIAIAVAVVISSRKT